MRFNICHVLFLVQIPQFATALTFVKYKKTKYTNTKFSYVIRKLKTRSLIQCAVVCDQTDACEAISFSPRGGVCEFSQYKPDDKHAKTIHKDGWSIYVKHAGVTSFTFGSLQDASIFSLTHMLRVYVVASHPTQVIVTAPLTDYRHVTTVNTGTEIFLTKHYLEGMTRVPVGIILESNTPVDVYVENAINPVSGGGSCVIPTRYLSTEYVLLSWHDATNYSTQFALIGTVDSTVVKIVFDNGSEKKLKLNRSQMFHHEETKDLSGTFISSSERIAVFAGHVCSTAMYRGVECDDLYEQVPPISGMQKEFIVSYPYPNYDYALRIMTVEDNTEISLSNGSTLLLNRLNKRQYLFNGVPVAITASKNILVAAYALGVAGVVYGKSMLVLPGLSQFKSEYNIFVPSNVHQCILMITFPSYQTSITRIRLNHEKMVANESATVNVAGRGEYTIMYKELSKGTSVIYTTDVTPFGAYLSFIRMDSQSWFSLAYSNV